MNSGGAGRQYPALDVTWPSAPSDLERELLLSAIDAEAATGLEDTPLGARVFFATADARDRAAVQLAAVLPGLSCSRADVDDERWAERSQEALRPIRVGDVVVVPAYNESKNSGLSPELHLGVEPQAHIFIRPSMGFGTGHHPSTRLCLGLLQQVPLDGALVLDAGTGSAVLAITAARLGAAAVRAIDNDPDALQSAWENVELNDAGHTVTVALSDLAGERSGPWDLVVANLSGAHLIATAAHLAALATPRGRLILGGIQTDEDTEVVGAFTRAAWTVSARSEEDGWIGLLLTRSSV